MRNVSQLSIFKLQQPTVLSIGGTVDVNNPVKFKEAHFHFRYVDYPCYDVTFAQFL